MPVIKAEEDRWSCLPGMNIICMTICSLLGFHSDLLESGRRSAQSCQSFDERSDQAIGPSDVTSYGTR
jgi:hypothetical protein